MAHLKKHFKAVTSSKLPLSLVVVKRPSLLQDGTAWHDIACYHKKNVICQDSQALLDYIGA